MIASKENFVLVLMSLVLLVAFLVLVTALKGDRNMLRVILAGGGFVGFGCLYAALLWARFKGLTS